MKIKNKIITAFLIPATFFISTTQAAEAVQWTDLPKKIEQFKFRVANGDGRHYRISTKAGQVYISYRLIFSPDGVRINEDGQSIPRDQVKEIRIERNGHFWDPLLVPGGTIVGFAMFAACMMGDECSPIRFPFIVYPLAVATTAAAVPVTLPITLIKGAERLSPDKVFNIAP